MNSIATANSSVAAALIRSSTTSARAAGPDSAAAMTLANVEATLANVTANVAKEGGAAIVAALVRIMSVTTAAPSNNAQTPIAGAAIILTELLNRTNDAAPMELNLNQLLNSALSQQSFAQKALAQLPPELLAKPQVIEALVLQNTLLPAASSEQPALPILVLPAAADATAAQSANTLYRINVEWQNRLIQLLSPQPLPTGTRVPLQIDARGAITLLRPEIAAKILLAQNTAARTLLSQPPEQPLPQSSLQVPFEATAQAIARQPSPLLASASQAPQQPPTPAQTIQQSLRELLPRQQALHTLVPLLQKFIAPSVRAQLPAPVFKALAHLLQSLPKPAQLRTAANVKQAINNSGSFLEAKLKQATTATPGAEPLPQIAATDIKAQINTLLALIRQFAPQAAVTPKPLVTPPAPQHAGEEDFVYAKPAPQNSAANLTPAHEHEHLDSLLAQLSKLLQAGFARIQLNQLDSANARHVSHETQAPVPTWVLELPLRTPHGVDQLQLRIEQRRKQQQQRTRVQWNVEIALDLHAAGKLAASLAIVDKSVSATLWAEREQTHRRVREEMNYLRAGLEAVGVRVTEIQCRLGLPAPRSQPISQRLVDVHT